MNSELKQLLLAYITKSASAQEKAWVKNWIAASEENETAFISLYKNYHKNLSTKHQYIDNEAAFERFLSDQIPPKQTINFPLFLKYAAVFFLICSIGLLFNKTFSPNKNESWKSVVVAKGDKNKMILPDGTKVYLNAGSRLAYDEGFNQNNRKVILDGEAYFDIAKSDKDIPFIVDAGGYIVRDIGTIFKIKSYSQDQEMEFSVVNGEISIENQKLHQKKIYLTKNQSIKINNKKQLEQLTKDKEQKVKIEKLIHEIPLPEESYKEWLSGTLTFDNTAFNEIMHTLEREFDLKITILDAELYNYHYSGAFKNIKNPDEILNVIKQTTPISYTIEGKAITVKKLTN
ncbi:FecR family protein [Pedobacter alpinus]|uniref:FecR family protein n=1 Tax=Pedobacter alpinus TaxID=1590643 RepID=A0ABW5TPW9_9SPHI